MGKIAETMLLQQVAQSHTGGDYNELVFLYMEIAEWIKQTGYQQEGNSLEYYYTGSDVPLNE